MIDSTVLLNLGELEVPTPFERRPMGPEPGTSDVLACSVMRMPRGWVEVQSVLSIEMNLLMRFILSEDKR